MTQKPNAPPLTIDQRLQNWGHCQRGKGGGSMSTRETRRASPYGGQGYSCMTNVVCTLMREAANGPKGGAATQAKFDFADAAVVNTAWLLLDARHKLLLRDFYALERPVNVICREMNIKHWPTSHWKRELLAAQTAIESIVKNQRGSAVNAEEIERQMKEYRQYNASSDETLYRWDFRERHVADKFTHGQGGDETAWAAVARRRAAHIIEDMLAQNA